MIPCQEPSAVHARPLIYPPRPPTARVILTHAAGIAVADGAHPVRRARPVVVLPSTQRRGRARHQEQHEAAHRSLAAGESYIGSSERGNAAVSVFARFTCLYKRRVHTAKLTANGRPALPALAGRLKLGRLLHPMPSWTIQCHRLLAVHHVSSRDVWGHNRSQSLHQVSRWNLQL